MRLFVGDDWRTLFDVIVTNARKPRWFTEDAEVARDRAEIEPRSSRDCVPQVSPLREVATGPNDDGSTLSVRPLPTPLRNGAVCEGGSVSELSRLAGWSGRRVLYLGDHLFTDLVEPRRGDVNWLTGALTIST